MPHTKKNGQLSKGLQNMSPPPSSFPLSPTTVHRVLHRPRRPRQEAQSQGGVQARGLRLHQLNLVQEDLLP